MKQLPTGFKDGFLWGGAVAACQIEGAYDVDGRGLSSSDIHAYDKNLNSARTSLVNVLISFLSVTVSHLFTTIISGLPSSRA